MCSEWLVLVGLILREECGDRRTLPGYETIWSVLEYGLRLIIYFRAFGDSVGLTIL